MWLMIQLLDMTLTALKVGLCGLALVIPVKMILEKRKSKR
jgi:hypothetical protein